MTSVDNYASRINPYASVNMGEQLISLSTDSFGLNRRTLSVDEKKLANDFNDYLSFNDTFLRILNGDKSQETLDYFNSQKRKYDDVYEAMGIQAFSIEDLATIGDPSSVDHTPYITYESFPNVPVGNSVTFEIGNLIDFGSYSLHITKNGVKVLSKSNEEIEEETNANKMAQALSNILYAAAHGDVSFGKTDLNNNALSILRTMGIDINRAFHINEQVFNVEEGVLKSVLSGSKKEPYGLHYLNVLRKKAYEQNAIYDDIISEKVVLV